MRGPLGGTKVRITEDGRMVDRATPNLPSRDLDATARFYARLGFVEKFHDEGWMIHAPRRARARVLSLSSSRPAREHSELLPTGLRRPRPARGVRGRGPTGLASRDTAAHLTGRPAVGLPGIRGRRSRRQPATLPGAARPAGGGRIVSAPLTRRANRCTRVPLNMRLKLTAPCFKGTVMFVT